MLQSIFSFRGQDYRGNRIPESLESLISAAEQIKIVHEAAQGEQQKQEEAMTTFRFTFLIPSQMQSERVIENETQMLNALAMALSDPNESNPVIKFFIYESEPQNSGQLVLSGEEEEEKQRVVLVDPERTEEDHSDEEDDLLLTDRLQRDSLLG